NKGVSRISRMGASKQGRVWKGISGDESVNGFMMRQVSRIVSASLFSFAVMSMAVMAPAQLAAKSPKVAQATVDRSLELAENGHCDEAMPLLKTSIRHVKDRGLQKRLGLDGLHCAMTHNAFLES